MGWLRKNSFLGTALAMSMLPWITSAHKIPSTNKTLEQVQTAVEKCFDGAGDARTCYKGFANEWGKFWMNAKKHKWSKEKVTIECTPDGDCDKSDNQTHNANKSHPSKISYHRPMNTSSWSDRKVNTLWSVWADKFEGATSVDYSASAIKTRVRECFKEQKPTILCYPYADWFRRYQNRWRVKTKETEWPNKTLICDQNGQCDDEGKGNIQL